MRFLAACLPALILMGCSGPGRSGGHDEPLFRVNCGGTEPYVDDSGAAWQADQVLESGAEWGAVGGGTVARNPALPVPATEAAEVYRTERFSPEAYEFSVPEGVYTLRLHFAETFDSNYREGLRRFDVSVDGREVLSGFDPYAEAGGFARPVVIAVAGIRPRDGTLRVTFQRAEGSEHGAEINGIEVLRTPGAGWSVRKLTRVTPAQERVSRGCRVVAREGRRTTVLFIGHSYTFFWALPETVACLVNSGQQDLRLETQRALRGGAGLDYFYRQTDVLERIEEGRFDYVVLGTNGDADLAARFNEVIRRSGARTLIYCPWVRAEEPPEAQDEVTRHYLDLARRLDAVFVPAGPAWQAAREERPDLGLHNVADGHHPGMFGSYLTACVFYAVLTGRSPEGHPCTATLAGQVPIGEAEADFLQRIARETVEAHGTSLGGRGR